MDVDPRHALPPAVCGTCLAEFLRQIETAGDQIKFLHCTHKGMGTLVRAEVRGGAILNWRLSAPVTYAEAKEQIAEHGRLLAAAGLLRPPGADVTH